LTVNVSDWSETPNSNVTIDGVNIAENCTPGNINNAIRSCMAGVRTFYTSYLALVTTVSGKLSAAGAVFSGTQPIYTGEGALLHHADAANTSGKVSLLPTGAALPSSPANGDVVLYYTP
jgi:hypothetical protein